MEGCLFSEFNATTLSVVVDPSVFFGLVEGAIVSGSASKEKPWGLAGLGLAPKFSPCLDACAVSTLPVLASLSRSALPKSVPESSSTSKGSLAP